jgi:Calcineurin-like phosphoesterase
MQIKPTLAALLVCAASTAHAHKPMAQPVTFVVLGDSRGCDYPWPAPDGGAPTTRKCDYDSSDGLNRAVLTRLLQSAAKESPQGVFFTGDLTLGLEREDGDDPGSSPAPKSWPGFVYDSKAFQRQLKAFGDVLTATVPGVPFHPVVGNHDALGPDAVELFVAQFNIKPGLEAKGHLGYGVDVGSNVHVSILATDHYSDKKKKLKEHELGKNMLEWLKLDLKANAGKFLFVMAHEPGYSIPKGEPDDHEDDGAGAAPAKKPPGLDHDAASTAERDELWKIMKKHKVSAYLCAHEHLYASGVQDGVWQIVTGGAGAKLAKLPPPSNPKAKSPAAMFHYLVITVPPTNQAVPHVEVRDLDNQLWDAFDLTPPGLSASRSGAPK